MTKRLISFLLATFLFASCNFNSKELINGSLSPEIALPGINKELIPLSSLRGKIVLIDFWASWCMPCRKVNPKLVAIYEKYKTARFQNAQGFEIYSISLDSNKDRWIKAIKEDKLNWTYHVSELSGWKSEAVQEYGVSAIPASYLIDQNGIIIGKDLRYQDLDKLLAKRIKQ